MTRRLEGVFPSLVNRAAFLDKVVVSIQGTKKGSTDRRLRDVTNEAIGGVGRKYARKESGVLASSGNSYDLAYGPMTLIGILPSMSLTIRSDRAPTTAAMVRSGMQAVCEECWRTSISQVELTFDFTAHPIRFFRHSIFTSAHRFRWLRDDDGKETFYFGGVTSPLEVTVYQKAEVVRLEFKFRRPFLRRHNINVISDLGRLRSLDLKRCLWLREVNERGAKALERRLRTQDEDDARSRILLKWIKDFRLRESIPAIKKHFGGFPEELIRASPVEEQIRRMQRRLVV